MWGELVALGVDQVDAVGRVISVNRKVVEVGGHLYTETPKNRKFRRTIYPRVTPDMYVGTTSGVLDRVRAATG